MRVPLVVPVLVSTVLAAGLAGCGGTGGGSDPAGETPPAAAPTARAALAARAAAAQDLAMVAFYDLVADGAERGTLLAVRAEDRSWRVDVPGGALGGTVDISLVHTGEELFWCQVGGGSGEGPADGCLRLDELTPEVDPRWQYVFTSWLDVFTDRAAPLAVSAAEPLPGTDQVEGDAGECYAVEPTAASLLAPVDPGVYCFAADGTLTAASLALGTLTLTGSAGTALPTAELPGPVAAGGEPLPTASPSPPAATGTPASSPTP